MSPPGQKAAKILRSAFGAQHSGRDTNGSPGATLRVASVRQGPNLVAPGALSNGAALSILASKTRGAMVAV